jgi:hypothetical protein
LKGAPWLLTAEQVAAARDYFGAPGRQRSQRARSAPPAALTDSEEKRWGPLVKNLDLKVE